MQWSTEELLYRLPSDAMIRQAADGKAPIPKNGALRSVYMNQIDRYELRKEAKQQKRQLASAHPGSMTASGEMDARAETMATQTEATNEMQPGASDESEAMSMAAAQSAPEKSGEAQLSEAQIERILLLAPDLRVAKLARMEQPEFDAFRRELNPAQRKALIAGLTPGQREVVGALENPKHVVVNELCEERLARDIDSSAQLEEVMTDFWLNHFNVFLHKNDETPYYLVSYERDAIRPRALGKFEDLLEATAHSPAMLLYLDNAGSMGPDSPAAEHAARNGKNNREGINENYARELMELHTLGVNGGYSQKDVVQVARVFTGWTVERPQRGGGFIFNENRHEPGTKVVFGKKIKERGEREGEQVLHMLAASPATAHFLSRELAERFVSDDPPQPLVDRMAHSYMKSGGDISAVLRTMFHSPEFWSGENFRGKVKTPLEYVVSAVRASDARIDDLLPLVRALQGMGMPLYGAVPPTGYSWQSSAWVSSGALVSRMNFALMLAEDKFGAISAGCPILSCAGRSGQTKGWDASEHPVSSAPIVASTHGTANAAPVEMPSVSAEEQRLEAMLVPGGVSDSTRSAIMNQAQNPPASARNNNMAAVGTLINPIKAAKDVEKQKELIAGLLLGSPEFQRR